jgi:hypothetical protein
MLLWKPLTTVLLAGCAMAAGGCLVMKGTQVQESGVRVSNATLNQVKPGETTEAWLRAALGEPTSTREVDERTRILRYDHRTVKESGGAVFLLFAGGESIEKTSSVIFEVQDGIVTRYWTES